MKPRPTTARIRSRERRDRRDGARPASHHHHPKTALAPVGTVIAGGYGMSEKVAAWVKPRVVRAARKDSREHTPTLQLGGGVGDADIVVASGLGAE
jgi:hypothetical protein